MCKNVFFNKEKHKSDIVMLSIRNNKTPAACFYRNIINSAVIKATPLHIGQHHNTPFWINWSEHMDVM